MRRGTQRRTLLVATELVPVEALMAPIFAEHGIARVGWPDDAVRVRLEDPHGLAVALATSITTLRALFPNAPLLADIDVYMEAQRLDLRIARSGASAPTTEDDRAQVRDALHAAMAPLRRLAVDEGGLAECGWWGTNFDLRLPAREVGPHLAGRKHFPGLPKTSWEKHYREKLRCTSFSSLRDEVYRFSDQATNIARSAATERSLRVLVPSVGLCVHPWLFAAASLSVVATDVSHTALATLANPSALPRVYGAKAQERWDISQSAAYGGHHPAPFASMPQLEDENTCAALRRRMSFIEADWARLPLEDASVDIVFATNALPRDDDEARGRVLGEWARVVRPGGLVYTQMHNDVGPSASAFFERLGWQPVDSLPEERRPGVTTFLERISSG
jgi:hypothetical protein